MQVSLEELLSMLLSRVEELTVDMENMKSRFNIMFRMLYKRGQFKEADVIEALRDENKILQELGMIKSMPEEAALKAAAENLMLWIKGDPKDIRRSMEELQRHIEAENQKRTAPKIETAPAGVLNEIDRLGGNGTKKLIL